MSLLLLLLLLQRQCGLSGLSGQSDVFLRGSFCWLVGAGRGVLAGGYAALEGAREGAAQG